jgi:hypothetical protein
VSHKIGPKEQQRIDLRLKRFAERGPSASREKRIMTEAPASKPISAPVEASAQPQEKTMTKRKATKLKAVSTGKADHFKIAGLKQAKRRTPSEAAANLKAAKLTARGRGKSANASTSRAKKADARARASDRKVVPALDVANFMARENGASMAELVEKFGIEAHPMRAKIHYIRNQIPGWEVETKDGRYFATAPKAA